MHRKAYMCHLNICLGLKVINFMSIADVAFDKCTDTSMDSQKSKTKSLIILLTLAVCPLLLMLLFNFMRK